MHFEDESPSHSSSHIAFPQSLLCGNCGCLCGKLSVEKGQMREAGRERKTQAHIPVEGAAPLISKEE